MTSITSLESRLVTTSKSTSKYDIEHAAGHELWAFCEHHEPASNLCQLNSFFENAGYNPICACADATGRGGTTAGTGVAASPIIAVFDFALYQNPCSQDRAGAILCWVKRGPIDFLLVTGYLQPSIGITAGNLQSLECWAMWLQVFKGPWKNNVKHVYARLTCFN